MKTKRLLAQTLALIVVGSVLLISSQAQEQLPPGTTRGFVTTVDKVKIHYFQAGPGSRRR